VRYGTKKEPDMYKADIHTIIIIDDNQQSQEFLKQSIREEERLKGCFKVTKQVDTKVRFEDEALGAYNLALVDLYMKDERATEIPKLLGPEIIRTIRNLEGNRIKILAVSTTRREDDVCRAYRAGVDALWHKDDLDDLSQALLSVMQNRQFISPSLMKQEDYWRALTLLGLNKKGRAQARSILKEAGKNAKLRQLPDKLELSASTVERRVQAIYNGLFGRKPLSLGDKYVAVQYWAKQIGAGDEVGVPEWFGNQAPVGGFPRDDSGSC